MNFYCLINLWEKNITFASAYILFLDLDPYIIMVTEGSHVARMSYSLINGMGKGKLFSTGPSELLWKNLFGKKTHEDVKLNSRYCFRNMYVQWIYILEFSPEKRRRRARKDGCIRRL